MSLTKEDPTKNKTPFDRWRELNEEISTLPTTEHGGVEDPESKQKLINERNQVLGQINKGTHYQGETIPSL